jgi:O-antigen ligase
MSGLLITVAAVAVFFAVWHLRGASAAAFVAVVAACSLSTVRLFAAGDSSTIAAMAPPSVVITTVQLALVGALLVLPMNVLRNISPWFLLFLFALGTITFVRGLSSPQIQSGMLQWLSVIIAWGVGGAIAQARAESGRPTDRFLVVCTAAIVAWHGAVVALQLLGVRAVSAIDVGDLEVTRASGLAGHSGNLGKIMFFLIVILLPLTRSTDRVARRVAVWAVIAAAAITGMSFSRGNTMAVFILIGVWLLLGPGISLAKRVLIPVAGLVAAIPIIDVLLLRNEYDPDGGSRPILLTSALHQISQTLWLGVGPNNYLNVVGQYDLLAAGGLPVHSAFLLALAEVGLLCAILLMIPLVLAPVRAVHSMRRTADARGFAVALLAASPGLILIAATGWGLLRGQYLVMTFFVLGYLVGGLRWTPKTPPDAPTIDDARSSRSRLRV